MLSSRVSSSLIDTNMTQQKSLHYNENERERKLMMMNNYNYDIFPFPFNW